MNTWSQLSSELSAAVQNVGKSVLTVQAGTRATSGIVLDDKTILTSAHAVSDEAKLRVFQTPDHAVDVTFVGRDYGSDVAVLRTETNLGIPASFQEDPQLAVGQLVVAVGRSWRGKLVASAGILSGLMGEWHTHRGKKIEAFIRPDLTLYRGFSGGALVGADQKIIGMSSVALRRGSPLAVPYATIRRVASVLQEKGYVPGPYLGLGLQPLRMPESLKQKLNLTEQVAALVVHVEHGSPAEAAGLMVGDVLLAIGESHFGEERTVSILSRLVPSQHALITGIRGGQRFSSNIVVGERPRTRG